MTPWEMLAVLGAGFGAGVLTATVGVASLLSFPVLLAVGLPPVVANATNTVGLTPGALSGSWGYREELRTHPRVTVMVMATAGLGSIVGALLLLRLPGSVFEALVPWLILATCVLVGLQPRLSAWLRRHHGGGRRLTPGPVTMAFAALTGVYGGYFGAGAGVMMLAVLALGLDLDMKVVNALKTLAVFASNLVATVIFLVLAPLDWSAIGLLAAGSVIGGLVGARIGKRLPAAVLRVLVVAAGVTAAGVMWIRG